MPVLLLDGGLGTCLESEPYNIRFSSNTPLWSSHLLITSPESLFGVHKAFAAAGSDVILTATYQASLEGFAATPKGALSRLKSGNTQKTDTHIQQRVTELSNTHGYYSHEEATELLRSAILLARRALVTTGKRGEVALSLGAYGATMRPSTEYSGKYMPDEMHTSRALIQWHARRLGMFRMDAVTWDDIDYVAFETIPILEEVRAVRQVMGDVDNISGNKKWWVSCVFPNDTFELPDGSTVDELVKALLGDSEAGDRRPWGIGINCTSISKLGSLVSLYEMAVQKTLQGASNITADEQLRWPWLVLYPDGAQGLVYNTNSQTWEADDSCRTTDLPRSWADEVARVVERTSDRGLWQGILVGGCCKTTPGDIARLRVRLIEKGLYET